MPQTAFAPGTRATRRALDSKKEKRAAPEQVVADLELLLDGQTLPPCVLRVANGAGSLDSTGPRPGGAHPHSARAPLRVGVSAPQAWTQESAILRLRARRGARSAFRRPQYCGGC